MPVVTLQVLGTLSDEQKSELSRRFTEDLREVAGKSPEYTYVIIQEVERTNWAHKGVLFSEK
jgi:4-oxalocrotonate tautomerase